MAENNDSDNFVLKEDETVVQEALKQFERKRDFQGVFKQAAGNS